MYFLCVPLRRLRPRYGNVYAIASGGGKHKTYSIVLQICWANNNSLEDTTKCLGLEKKNKEVYDDLEKIFLKKNYGRRICDGPDPLNAQIDEYTGSRRTGREEMYGVFSELSSNRTIEVRAMMSGLVSAKFNHNSPQDIKKYSKDKLQGYASINPLKNTTIF